MMEEMDDVLMKPVDFTETTHPEFEDLPKFKLEDLFLNYD